MPASPGPGHPIQHSCGYGPQARYKGRYAKKVAGAAPRLRYDGRHRIPPSRNGRTVKPSKPHHPRNARLCTPRGAWLSLFAMLMIFAGPLLSQAMPGTPAAGMSMAMDMPMGMAMPSEHQHAHRQAGDYDHALWEKCGYCSLLFHSPAASGNLAVSAVLPPPPALGPVPAALSGHSREVALFLAGPRAPPLA